MMLNCFRKTSRSCLIICLISLLCISGCNLKRPPAFKAGSGSIEAEDCLLSLSDIRVDASYSGGKAVSGISKDGSSVSFAYDTDNAGYYDLSIDYVNNGDGGTLGLFIDDHFFMKVFFPSGSGTITETISLKGNLDTIRL